ncbi:spore coat protein CotJB [Sporolactobacillus sp. CPB3-1]|uniref:Spore coat protein CotJB n=1 Tax=Sporolactobacillus mangiferae TaxID=2940498 RepID=A0ABT0MAF4_9BACL|nr:spore coat protein CotJB [Sporolactobacillus mangiferae]MCL1631851.1 spore coat protein CotJB [Sporolactobacillus mangiferae]
MDAPAQVPDSYYSDLKALQAVDFTLVELTLYLDTHPTDLEALKQFNSTAKKSAELREGFEARYGPLRQFGYSLSAYPWQWKDVPWPWQV